MRSLRLRPQWSHPPSAHLSLQLELPSLASKPNTYLRFERHVIPDGSGEIKRTKQWREIHTLKIYVNCKLILICFYAQFSPPLNLVLFSLQRTSVPPRPKISSLDQKYLVLSSFVRFLHLEMHPLAGCIISWAIHPLQNIRTKRLPAISAAWSPNLCLHLDSLRVLDATTVQWCTGTTPRGAKGEAFFLLRASGIGCLVFGTFVSWLLSQQATLHSLHP